MKRDISVIDLTSKQKLVIACDSSGGIGPKPGDKVSAPGKIVGKFGVRVALMEILAVRATPISVINTLAVEYEPAGKTIIKGIKQELEILDVEPEKVLTGSTEENISTTETGLGITVIGSINSQEFKAATTQSSDVLVAIGLPKVGEEVLASKEEIADLQDMKQLLNLDYAHDILPVGSKGIKYEVKLLTEMNGLSLSLMETNLNLQKSAGPATVLLVTLPESRLKDLKHKFGKPLNVIGHFRS